MARYSSSWSGITAAALADSVAATNNTYPGSLRGGSATTLARISEVDISGEDSASTPTQMILGRAVIVSVGALSVGNSALLDVQATAPGTLMAWGNTAATSGAQRSPTLYLLQPSLNTWGGIHRWQARMGEEVTLFGTAVNAGEVLLSSKVGAGKTSGHIIYELV